MVEPTHLERYARILVSHAVGLRPGQDLYVRGTEEHADFASKVGEAGYEIGARSVSYRLTRADEIAQLIRRGSPEHILLHHERERDYYSEIVQRGGALIMLSSHFEPPEALQQAACANPRNYALFLQGRRENLDFLCKPSAWRVFPCTIVPVATPRWAQKIFPEMPPNEATARLWNLLFQISCTDQPDAVNRLKARTAKIREREAALNQLEIREILITGGGNHLKLALSPKARWANAGFQTKEGQTFFFNFPSEEIFTAPDCRTTEGRLLASQPLRLYDGTMVENLVLDFRAGRVVGCEASSGREALAKWLQTDPGACRLGELGLVGRDSAVGQTQTRFDFNNLDENAAAHVALGQAFALNLEGGETLTETERTEHGWNRSAIHMDVLFGSENVTVQATKTNAGSFTLIEGDGAR
ncbi:MAG: aminopeptidase [Thermoanaerobaculia bacterium]|nr:aminopeptidase [Thermoanaerobaculia bacterium]